MSRKTGVLTEEMLCRLSGRSALMSELRAKVNTENNIWFQFPATVILSGREEEGN